jgi:hypothetical protein
VEGLLFLIVFQFIPVPYFVYVEGFICCGYCFYLLGRPVVCSYCLQYLLRVYFIGKTIS